MIICMHQTELNQTKLKNLNFINSYQKLIIKIITESELCVNIYELQLGN